MFSVIILDFDGFLSKKEKLTGINFINLINIFYESWGVVTCKRHEAQASMKFHSGAKYLRYREIKCT